MRVRSRLLLAVILGAVAAASFIFFMGPGWESIRRLFRPESPYQRYARSLAKGGPTNAALATQWLAAGTRAVERPVAVPLPFTQDLVLDHTGAVAVGYALTLKRGQKLDVRVSVPSDRLARVFVDLFAPGPVSPDRAAIVSAGDDATALSREIQESGLYTVRIQPELRAGGRPRVLLSSGPSLSFPVSGGAARDVQSVFGDQRDAGRRRHEGVDIFAPRGTPVLAASDGFVTRVGENSLGGRVVWVWDISRGLTLYYAHLQDQQVRAGRFVHTGELLGTVGNTGNARTTPPHLHFGIYARGEGAIDPAPFIRPAPAPPP
jgi:murein DD-endopeptidase MepM/ murein hydrolase activator NlpD